MLEAEHPVPEAWVWCLEPGGAGGEGRGHGGREGAGRAVAGLQPRGPGHRDIPPEAACPSAKPLTSWASFSRLQGGHRGHAGQGQDDRTVRLVLLRRPLRAGPRGSPLSFPWPVVRRARLPGAPPREARSRNPSPEGTMLGHPRPQEALGCPHLPCPWPPAVPLASPGPLEGPDRRALERSIPKRGNWGWEMEGASQAGLRPLCGTRVRVFPAPPPQLCTVQAPTFLLLAPVPPLRKLCL